MTLRHRQLGLSIVELMIAAVLGMVLAASVLGVYVNSSRSMNEVERYAQMQENGRYALRVLTEDLMMVDFWGQVTSPDTVSTSVAVSSGDCGEGIDVYNPTTGLLGNDNHADAATAQFTPCTGISADLMSDSDVVVIKRVAGSPSARTFVDVNDSDGDSNTTETLTTGAANLELGVVYLRSNGVNATFIDDAASGNPPALGESDWQYLPRIYFIRDHYASADDGVPALCRRELSGRNLSATACLAEGIEDLRVHYGIDTGSDGIPDLYAANPTLAQMESAISARIFVLARSKEADANHVDAKTYNLGDVLVAAANDGFYRSVFTSTIVLRNTANLSQMD